MAHIVAAEFKDLAAAEAALDALRGQGFVPSHLTSFYLDAPGARDLFAIDGKSFEASEWRLEPQSVPLAGVVVAVNVPTMPERERATSILWRHRAHSIELAEGIWKDGTWQDFNPVAIPQ